jgi:DNA-binding beta-propeller fold protein YncE
MIGPIARMFGVPAMVVSRAVFALMLLTLTGCEDCTQDVEDVKVPVKLPNGKEYIVVWKYTALLGGGVDMDSVQVYDMDADGGEGSEVNDTTLEVEAEVQAEQVLDGRGNGATSNGRAFAKGIVKGDASAVVGGPANISAYLLDVDNLYQFNPATNQVSRSLSLISGLNGSPTRFKVTSDGRYAVVTNNSPNGPPYVLIIDLTSFSIVANIPAPANLNLSGVEITPDNLFAYVVGSPATTGSCAILVIDLATQMIATTIPLPDDQTLTSIVMTPDGAEAYLGSCCSTLFSIPVIDIPTNTVSTRVSLEYFSAQTGLLPDLPPAYIAMHPDGTRVYFAPMDGSPVLILNTATKNITKAIQIPQGSMPPFGTDPHFTPDGQLLFILNGSNAISVINTTTDTLWSTLPLDPTLVGQPPGGVRVGFFFIPNS